MTATTSKFDDHEDQYYLSLEYQEDDADGKAIDVGKSPIPIEQGFRKQRVMQKQQRQVTSGSTSSSPKMDCNRNEEVRDSPCASPSPSLASTASHSQSDTAMPQPPKPPTELPDRFLKAGKGNVKEGERRYKETLAWRAENNMDTIIQTPHPQFALIKKHYPHYFHLRSRSGSPVYFEKPPKTNLKALKAGGVNLQELLRHYAMVTEFGWQVLERSDTAQCVTVIDLEGIRMTDFVGDCVDFVRKASEFTGAHYPERAGKVLVVNVPSWFKMIWTVVKPMIDEVTLAKIAILRGKKEVYRALLEIMDEKCIPPEYGGKSMPLGESPEEKKLWAFVNHNNAKKCGAGGSNCCEFCRWVPARSY